MKFSIMTEPQLGGTYDQQLAAAKLAEAEGLVSFARSDHLAWSGEPTPDATDAFATMGGLARDTETVRLCVLVSPITFRHPAIIAKNAATISQMSDGRFDLGVGTGWNDFEHEKLGIPFPESAERWARFEDALSYLEEAFGNGHGKHDGPFYSLDLDVKPKPTGLRLIVGGSGPKRTPRLAGAHADEYNFFICPPSEASAKIATMRKAAGDRTVEATTMAPPTVGATDSEYQTRLRAAASARDVDPDQLEDRWKQAGMIFGTPNQAREAVAALEKAGVERIYIQWFDLADFDGLASTIDIIRS